MIGRDDEGIPIDDEIFGPAERPKRVRISSDVGDVGGFDTLEEGWKAYQTHHADIMPMLKKRRKKATGRYWFFVGREEMTVDQFRYAVEKERRDKGKPLPPKA